MSAALGDGINRQPPLDNPSREMELSKQERELIVKLRLLDFWRVGRVRKALAEWNGARLNVFDANQQV